MVTSRSTVAAAAQERLTGVLAVDPLGAVDDGGMAAFAQEMDERTPPEDRDRAEELDERVLRGEGTAEDDLESLRAVLAGVLLLA